MLSQCRVPAVKELKAIGKAAPGSWLRAGPWGGGGGPAGEEAVLKGDGSRHHRQTWLTAQQETCRVDGHVFPLLKSQELRSSLAEGALRPTVPCLRHGEAAWRRP